MTGIHDARALQRQLLPLLLLRHAAHTFAFASRRQRLGDHLQHRHAHRDTIGHLLFDHRCRAMRHRRGDLDAFVHRPRMQHQRAGLRQFQPLLIQPVALRVFAERREQTRLLAFPLQP